MDPLAHFHSFARYNAWANRRLYAACAELPAAELAAPRVTFFGSILNTLNHVLVGDRIWAARIEGADPGIKALDTILYADFADLRTAREQEDAGLIARIDALDAHDLNRDIVYRSTTMVENRSRLHEILAHLFNHQTHHRGQVHACLSGTAVSPPPLDLMFFLREGR
ncbi:MAG: DinB family protein [Alphaproteobacteria bacterium]